MKKGIFTLYILVCTAFLTAGGDLTPVEAVAPANVCHKDLTYIERDVGLMWQDQQYIDAEDGAVARNRNVGKAGNWKHAMRYCKNLYYAGYADWRLPTSDELTHVHRIEGQVFSYFREKDFWTSTPTTDGKYYVVYPVDAYIYKRKTRESNFIRCVRCTGDIRGVEKKKSFLFF